MTTRHTISHADEVYKGDVHYGPYSPDGRRGLKLGDIVFHTYGAIVTADADGYCASQDLTAAGVFSVDVTAAAALAAAALAGTADVPRNVVAAWTGTAVITITGTDAYGQTVVESSGSGTSLTGKKAFKTVTGIAVSGNVTGLTVGTGVVIGLPVRIDNLDQLYVNMDGASTTSTTVAAVDTDPATATTGDVRGTFISGTAPNSARRFSVLICQPDTSTKELAFGVSQFAG